MWFLGWSNFGLPVGFSLFRFLMISMVAFRSLGLVVWSLGFGGFPAGFVLLWLV